MRKFFFWIVTLLIIAGVAYWAWATFAPGTSYAPGPEDGASAVEPTPPPPDDLPGELPPAKTPDAEAGGLPGQPIPYDQLNNGQAPAGEAAPPAPKSDDKAIFY
jgi:hypothetical protein